MNATRTRCAQALFSLLVVLLTVASSARAGQAEELTGRWGGAIDLPTGQSLQFFVTFEQRPAGELAAELDIPSQGVADFPLVAVDVSEEGVVTFAAAQFNAVWTGELAAAGDAIAGRFEQAGQTMPFTMAPAAEDADEAPAREAPPDAVRWGGAAQIGGMPLGIEIAIDDDENEGPSAWLTIPMQGIRQAPLKDVQLGEKRLFFRFEPEGAPFDAVFELLVDGERATGAIRQAGQTFPLELQRLEKGERADVLPRPQHPKPPFPYEAREIAFENADAGVMLAGTLTIPEGQGPHPAVILLTGSGPQDRDETLAGHKPFLVIADHLTRRGIAVLRYDDRGVGGSSGSTLDSTVEDFAADALAAAAWLREQSEVDGARIGLIGHSEGGAVAAEAATRASERVACVVSLAGMAETGGETLLRQLPMMLRAGGVDEDVVTTQSAAQKRLVEAIGGGESDERVRAVLVELMEMQLGDTPHDAAVNAQLDMLTSQWMRHLINYDPRNAFAQVRAPILAINGEIDRQVDPAANLSVIWAAAQRGGNDDVTTIILPGLNHLLQDAETGGMDEYAQIEQTIAPVALEVMTEWLRERMELAD